MKKIIKILISLFFVSLSYGIHAQVVEKTGKKIEKGAKKVGNKTAEVASKGKAKVTDKTYKDKVGPDGQTIYIDGHSKYYYIDKKGHRQYLIKAQLKDKVD